MAIDKLEYGDLHKFLASLGLGFMVSAVVVPWLFLREPFDLQVETTKLAGVTDQARELIIYRQQVALLLVRAIPWFSGALLVIGLSLMIFGLVGWRKRQAVVDRKSDLEVVKLAKEVRNIPEGDLQEKVASEGAEVEDPELAFGEGGRNNEPQGGAKYGEVERLLIERITSCLEETYRIRPHQQLGRAQFDLLLQAKDERKGDLVVEVKFTSDALDWRYVRANLLKTVYLCELYGRSVGRQSIPVIYFVAPRRCLIKTNIPYLERKARREAKRLDIEIGMKILEEEDLPGLSCDQLTTAMLLGDRAGVGV
jgi:hypothetical protein